MPTADEVGRRVKTARRELGMTLKEVAEASGMSPTHISEIERGKTSPTVGALKKIAGALSREAAYFVEEEPLPRISVVKKEDRTEVLIPGQENAFVKGKALTKGIPAGRIDVVMIDDSEGATVEPHSHEGEEAILVLAGAAEVVVGDETFRLAQGDCLHYNAAGPHRARFTGKGRNKAIWAKVKPGTMQW